MRLKSVRFFLMAALLLSMAIPAAAQDTMWKGVFTSAQAARGKESYDRNCSRCHNLALIGSERGPAIKGNTFLSHWEKDTMAALFTKVRDTMPEGNSGTVSDEVKIDVISYILQQNGVPAGATELTKDLSSLEEIRMTKKTIWDGVFTTAQAERGKTALLRNGCNGCHGAELAGDRGPSLKGERFIAAWENGSVNRLLTKIRDTMPPLNAEQVSTATKVDIIAYLLEVNGFPAGSVELGLDAESLEAFQIVRKGAEPAGPPNFALVEVVGCLTELPNSRWALTNSTDPVATREETPTAAAEKAAATNPIGAQTFQLVSVRSAFRAESHRGHKMEARGLLYRDTGYAELNLTSLEMLGSTCTN